MSKGAWPYSNITREQMKNINEYIKECSRCPHCHKLPNEEKTDETE